MRLSIVEGEGSRMSINLWCVLVSNCSRESLFTCGDLKTVYLRILVGKGTGPETLASASQTQPLVASELFPDSLLDLKQLYCRAWNGR